MRELNCDVLILGGGTGGVAAALAATDAGLRVVLTEETDWIGGQLTSQGVPPDEHPWIEQFGCTRRYREYRNRVRAHFRTHYALKPEITGPFNPGGGWVSKLCHEPRVGWQVLSEMVAPAIARGLLDLRLHTVLKPDASAVTEGDSVRAVTLLNLETGEEFVVSASYFVDATELGDLLPAANIEYVTGAESQDDTGEPHAPTGPAQPANEQAFTWVFAMAHDEGSDRTIDRPATYDFWKAFRPSFWPNDWLSMSDVNPITLEQRHMPLFSDDWRCWFKYRQIVQPAHFVPGQEPHPVTIVNWPMNDYLPGRLSDVSPEERARHLEASKELGRSLLYYIQSELGFKGMYFSPEVMGTPDGFAKYPYIRESRRIQSLRTVVEQDVSAALHPGAVIAPAMEDSVGIGAYRIDLHPSTGGDNYIDLSSLPFQIPLGALIPKRVRNVIAAAKNIGATHITNGCYRLHPVEWNIGEAAGTLAAVALQSGNEPHAIWESSGLRREFQNRLVDDGFELSWPLMRPL